MALIAAGWIFWPNGSLADPQDNKGKQLAAVADNLAAETAATLLAQRGLTLTGGRWLCAEDVRLRRQLDSLEQLQKQLRQSRRTLDQRIEANEAAGKTLLEIEKNIAAGQKASASAGDAATRRRLTDELARLNAAATSVRTRYLPSESFAADPTNRAALVGWINARNAIALIALGYATYADQVQKRYEALGRDEEVTLALAAVGHHNGLGGPRNGPTAEQIIDEARRSAINVDAPLYRVSGQWRTSILIGDTTPAACTLMDQGPPLLIPDSVARAAEIKIPADAPGRRHTAPDGRSLEVRVVTLPRIRIGPRVISQVEAWVLPPEAEDLSVQLGRQYLGGYRLELQPAKLRLLLQ